MARVWLDGFDHYNSLADLLAGNYTTAGVSAKVAIETNAANVRTGSRAISLNNSSGTTSGFITQTISGRNKLVLGAATKENNVTAEKQIRAQGSLGSDFFGVYLGNNGQPRLIWNDTVVWTSDTQLSIAGVYQYHEVSIDINSLEMEYRFNGLPKVVVSGLPVYAGNLINHTLICNGGGGQMYCDDYYVDDAGFLGAQRCYTRFADADETPQDWVGVLAPAFNNLNDVPYNVANYIEGANVGDISRFGFEDLPSLNAIVNGVRLSSVQALTAAGSGETKQSLIVSGGGTIAGSNKALSTSPTFYNDVADLSASIANVNLSSLEIEKVS